MEQQIKTSVAACFLGDLLAWAAKETRPSQDDEAETIVIMFEAHSYCMGKLSLSPIPNPILPFYKKFL